MKVYISDFYHIRLFKPNMIPIAVTGSWPYWMYEYNHQKTGNFFLDKNNVINGIREEMFFDGYKDRFECLSEKCGEAKPCPYLDKVPHCQFMDSYLDYLRTLDINKLFLEFDRVSKEVELINHYVGEPIIVLIVYESSKCSCAERPCIQQWFRENGYELNEWTTDLLDDLEVF